MWLLWTRLECKSHHDPEHWEVWHLWITCRTFPSVYLVLTIVTEKMKCKIIDTGWFLYTSRHSISKWFIDNISIIVVIICVWVFCLCNMYMQGTLKTWKKTHCLSVTWMQTYVSLHVGADNPRFFRRAAGAFNYRHISPATLNISYCFSLSL